MELKLKRSKRLGGAWVGHLVLVGLCGCNAATSLSLEPDAGATSLEDAAPLAEAPDAALTLAILEDGEWAPGGETTNVLVGGDLAFTLPAANLVGAERSPFFSGNAFFNEDWVEAPSSTQARDGLGPTFNARSCSTCHFKDGRGRPPEDGATLESMLFRLSVPGEPGEAPRDEPVYGGQLQPFGVTGVEGEGRVQIRYAEREVAAEDGTRFSLRVPSYEFSDWAFGEPQMDFQFSPRVAPHMIGLGLLEAIPEERLRELEDPMDADSDGISGRLNRVWDQLEQDYRPGRFGWKAEQPTVLQQVAGAFLGDMGITTSLNPEEDCPEAQVACREAPTGGAPESSETILDRVVFYSSVVAPPARVGVDAEPVLLGKALFAEIGCGGCHMPSHDTGASEIPQLANQQIWPYTDLLLHDMGESLADHRPTFSADGQEWRTPPLWGIGRFPDVNGHMLLLHDGRARGVIEAVLWHGGEGDASREAFLALNAKHRNALVAFVESL